MEKLRLTKKIREYKCLQKRWKLRWKKRWQNNPRIWAKRKKLWWKCRCNKHWRWWKLSNRWEIKWANKLIKLMMEWTPINRWRSLSPTKDSLKETQPKKGLLHLNNLYQNKNHLIMFRIVTLFLLNNMNHQ